MGERQQPSGVHLVGSIPVQSASDAFVTASRALPHRLSSFPDGETGRRGTFVVWQRSVLPKAILQQRSGGPPPESRGAFDFKLSDFNPTEYDDHAIQSYATFKELQTAGTIPSDVRFQVSLPSPTSVVRIFVATEYCEKAEVLYEERLLQALRRIQDNIPAHQLLIQWDIPLEIALLEYDAGRLKIPYFETYFSPVKAGILERLNRLVAAVDHDVEVGFHICYGDIGGVHFIQPEDMAIMVDLANSIVQNLTSTHAVKYTHMPVPKDRTNEHFFKPLANLKLDKTKLFLGLVHPNDEEGTKQRIAAAQSVYSEVFGVATECGLGRTSVENLKSIFEISRSVTTPDQQAEASH